MKPKRQKLASLAQEICKLWFQFFGAVFASKGYPFKNILAGTPKDKKHSSLSSKLELKGLVKPETASSTCISFQCNEELFQYIEL